MFGFVGLLLPLWSFWSASSPSMLTLSASGSGILAAALGLFSKTRVALLLCAPLMIAYYASNIVTALPDVPSDGRSSRLTYPVRFGQVGRLQCCDLSNPAFANFVVHCSVKHHPNRLFGCDIYVKN